MRHMRHASRASHAVRGMRHASHAPCAMQPRAIRHTSYASHATRVVQAMLPRQPCAMKPYTMRAMQSIDARQRACEPRHASHTMRARNAASQAMMHESNKPAVRAMRATHSSHAMWTSTVGHRQNELVGAATHDSQPVSDDAPNCTQSACQMQRHRGQDTTGKIRREHVEEMHRSGAARAECSATRHSA